MSAIRWGQVMWQALGVTVAQMMPAAASAGAATWTSPFAIVPGLNNAPHEAMDAVGDSAAEWQPSSGGAAVAVRPAGGSWQTTTRRSGGSPGQRTDRGTAPGT